MMRFIFISFFLILTFSTSFSQKNLFVGAGYSKSFFLNKYYRPDFNFAPISIFPDYYHNTQFNILHYGDSGHLAFSHLISYNNFEYTNMTEPDTRHGPPWNWNPQFDGRFTSTKNHNLVFSTHILYLFMRRKFEPYSGMGIEFQYTTKSTSESYDIWSYRNPNYIYIKDSTFIKNPAKSIKKNFPSSFYLSLRNGFNLKIYEKLYLGMDANVKLCWYNYIYWYEDHGTGTIMTSISLNLFYKLK